MSSIVSRISAIAMLIGVGAVPVAFAQSEQPTDVPAVTPPSSTEQAVPSSETESLKVDEGEPAAATGTSKPDVPIETAKEEDSNSVPSVLAQPDEPAAPVVGSSVDDPVVATVNGKAIHRSYLEAVHEAIPQASTMPLEVVYASLLDRLITTQLMVEKAREENLQDNPVVKTRLEITEDQILQMSYLEQQLDRDITEDMMKARYEEEIAKLPPMEELQAHHILVKTKKEAETIIKDLTKKNPKSFEELAREKSIDDTTKEQGGDLGYFSLDDMVPEFSEAVKDLQPGEISKTPVETQFGWHVVRVDDRRPVAPPTYDEVKDQIRAILSQEKTIQIVNSLKAGATIVEYNLDGTKKP